MTKSEDAAKLSDQQKLLLDQMYFLLEAFDRAGEHLDKKAATAIIVAFVGLLATLSVWSGGYLSPLAASGFVVAFLAFVGTIGAAMMAWIPGVQKLPGSLDWDEMHEAVIFKSVEGGYSQILSDCVDAIQDSRARNLKKTKWIRVASVLLIVQVVGLLLTLF